MSNGLSDNYFELFGVAPRYRIDKDALEERYRALQHRVHPDRYASASDQERRVAMQQAAQINEAYRVLRDPIARARYLLEQRGHKFQDQQHTHQDPEFLMEQIELREALAEVRGEDNVLQALADLMERIEQRVASLTEDVARLLDDDKSDPAADAVAAVQRMQFFRRLLEEASELEMELQEEIGDF
jgi:molecular chaperone HscB